MLVRDSRTSSASGAFGRRGETMKDFLGAEKVRIALTPTLQAAQSERPLS
jgi:hypothetical protein